MTLADTMAGSSPEWCRLTRFHRPQNEKRKQNTSTDGVERKRLYMTQPENLTRCTQRLLCKHNVSAPHTLGFCEQSGVFSGRQLADRLSTRNRRVRTRPRFRQMGFGGNRRLVEGQGEFAHLHDSTKFQSMRGYCAIRRAVLGGFHCPTDTPCVTDLYNCALGKKPIVRHPSALKPDHPPKKM